MPNRPYYPHRYDHDAARAALAQIRAGELVATPDEIAALDLVAGMAAAGESVDQSTILAAHDVIWRMTSVSARQLPSTTNRSESK